MRKLKKAIVLSLVVCMSLFMSINVYADGIPYCPTTHTVGQLAWPADYAECDGGYERDVYVCAVCNAAVFEDGSPAVRTDGTGVHTAQGSLHEADFTQCLGGYKVDYYKCICGAVVDENGTEIAWTDGTLIHTPGTELYKADYVECMGGFKEDYYLCTACGNPTDKDGKGMFVEPGTDAHKPGTTEYPANYTSCRGGYDVAHYYCTVCNRGVDVNGNHILRYPGDGNHEIAAVPAKAATTQAEGNLAYWKCEICGLAFKDKDGNEYIRDISAYIIPKLPQDSGEKEPATGPVAGNKNVEDTSAISPDTGDETPLAFISCLMLLSLLGLGMTWMRDRKTEHMNE